MAIESFGGDAQTSPMNNQDLDNRINQETSRLIDSILRSIDQTQLKDFDSLIRQMAMNGFSNLLEGLNLDSTLESDFRSKIFENRKIQRAIEENIEREQFDRILTRVRQTLPDLPRTRQEAIAREELNNIIRTRRAENKGLSIRTPEDLEGIRDRTPQRIRIYRNPSRLAEERGIIRQKGSSGTSYVRTKPKKFTRNEEQFLRNNIGMNIEEVARMHSQIFETPRTISSLKNKLGRIQRQNTR